MNESAAPCVKSNLPLILTAALVQGLGLLTLDRSYSRLHDPAWLAAFYAGVCFGPLTVQLLAGHARNAIMWVLALGITGAFFYFGWHEGAIRMRNDFEEHWVFTVALTVLWLLILPFVQARLAGGQWHGPYATVFADAWRNLLVLAEAALFTGLFWLILELWQALFVMLRIPFFRDLFDSTAFVYPVTAVTFGIALHLIGSIDRLTSVVLEQLLNVLKWLALVAGCLLTLFTVALVFSLPGLVFTGERAISAVWLLWLVAVIILLLNAAFRDGSIQRPYPQWIAIALRYTVPLLLIISATAIYSLWVRTQHYGITVGRCWAWIVAGTLFLYSAGYSFAAFNRAAWMGGMARVNVVVAIILICVIGTTLTPALAPERLAANSQFARILNRSLADAEMRVEAGSPFVYLRFESGTYGEARLKQLAAVGPDADDIRQQVLAALALEYRGAAFQEARYDEFRKTLGKAVIHPAGRTLTALLVEDLVAQWKKVPDESLYQSCAAGHCDGIFVDLNGDGVDEFVLVAVYGGWAFEQHDGDWRYVGSVSNEMPAGVTWRQVHDAMRNGELSTAVPQWKLLSMGGSWFRVDPDR
jgi:hypothetical protein